MPPPALLLLLAAAFAMPTAQAEDSVARFLTFENDRYFHTDHYYTNGIQYSTRRTAAASPAWLDRVCRYGGCAEEALVSVQQNFGQLMYTPTHINVAAAQPLDRPWAGLLYSERAYTLETADHDRLTTITLQAGLTGSMSLAEKSQKLVHRILNVEEPQGWHNQVGNTLAVLGTLERRQAVPALRADFGNGIQIRTAAYWRVGVGSIMSYGAVGALVTIGKDLPELSPVPVGILNKVSVAPTDLACLLSSVRCTVFAGIEGRYMAYNIFLQGRPFQTDPQVEPRRWVGDLMTGVRIDFIHTGTAQHGPWYIQFKATRRSKEFRSGGPVSAQAFGALTIGRDW
ncbi:lipid A deacylase LpxR family protein [Massilia arenosa]|uniref:Lipid A deacylase LpxR family protein n=1 Tax=Zemynaea arenosa TaxID=2561931 RepID=A0A4Y9SK77_9BURK|nr:lipid A deacylase LpxR family protein [Massilia arenosa]TFW23399.1 lipid A deacylase LpxR family protein [Massilia arenosa]